MKEILQLLELPDYHFLSGVLRNLGSSSHLEDNVRKFEQDPSDENRANLDDTLERELRYLGSSDIAYWARYFSGIEPGVSFKQIIIDVARQLHVGISRTIGDREMLEELVQSYATLHFSNLTPEEQQKMLTDLGVEADRAKAFILKSAGAFALPALVQTFGNLIVNGLIKNIVFGTISKIIGKQLSGQLFKLLLSRFPWWTRWIGPAAWSFSIGWTMLDLQGPAYRKTVPAILYLGLCSLRARESSEVAQKRPATAF